MHVARRFAGRLLVSGTALLALLTIAACGDDDATPPPVPDAGPTTCAATTPLPDLRWMRTALGSTVGVTRDNTLGLARDFCADVVVTLESSMPSVATVPASLTIPVGQSDVATTITPVAVGTTTITAHVTRGMSTWTGTFNFDVVSATLPACAGTAAGNVAPGGRVTVAAGTTLAGSEVFVQPGATRDDFFHVPAFDATIGCAPDQVPAGYRALGPAVTVGPTAFRTMREIEVAIPVSLALLPENANRGHVLMSYTSALVHEPTIVPFARPSFEGGWGNGILRFQTPRLGTFQAVVADTAGASRMREYKFRGVTGFSMGAIGSAQLGLRHPDVFDFSAPLGGPTDFVQTIHYFREYNFGGFCNEAERLANPTECAAGAAEGRTPPNDQLYQHTQDFEHWYYEDEYGGQGGTFDRREWMQIFRDLSFMYGNPSTNRTDDPTQPNITPPGVPDSTRMIPDAERCAHPIVIPPDVPGDANAMTGFFDDEFNPEGAHPVITFCDGAEIPVAGGGRDVGIWDPAGNNDYPAESFLAVDINDNGVRDPGEPVVRDMWEHFLDVGLDGLASVDEPGYDAVTNPDPNGDDYDFQFNPRGTEGNWYRDGADEVAGAPGVAEPFEDFGLDGVLGSPQLSEGGYDFGEGNGRYDRASGTQRMFDRNPKQLALKMDAATLADLDIFADGGIRDLLNSLPSMNHFIGAFQARDRGVRMYNGHSSLYYTGLTADNAFDFTTIPWDEVGGTVLVRYGDPDADHQLLVDGDGGHVGTGDQLINRILSALSWMSARWPDGDRRTQRDRLCETGDAACPNPNKIVMSFESPTTHRVGPAAIILPPGYFRPENAGLHYPVVYFGHGYGMSPEGLVELGLVFWTYMISDRIPEAHRLQKMIFVFPDGKCSGTECIQGTFYTDAPEGTPNGAQMETWMLDLMDYMDANYRTRSNETFEYTP